MGEREAEAEAKRVGREGISRQKYKYVVQDRVKVVRGGEAEVKEKEI